MQTFISHFHPVLVHLPIGILLITCLFQWLVLQERYKKLEAAIGIALCWGMITAIASCITGFLLNQAGEYDESLALKHQWLGISVALVSVIQYYLFRKSVNKAFARWIALLLALLIVLTGHLGGSLTHGSDYLSFNQKPEGEAVFVRKPVADIQSAGAYEEVVKPILQDKCYSCHGSAKQKGKLRLDGPDYIIKGGKEGNTLVPGSAGKSELIKRILMPRNEEHHMPPREKKQLTEAEISLLHWWVDKGALFDKTVGEIDQPEKIKPLLLALQKETDIAEPLTDIPAAPVKPAPAAAIDTLKKRGVLLLPVTQNSYYLQANFINADSFSMKDWQLLLPLQEQLIWLKLSNLPVNDSVLRSLSALTRLTRLHLDRTAVGDPSLEVISRFKELNYLNLVGTKVTAAGLKQLKGMTALRSVYLYQTAIGKTEWSSLQKELPGVRLDSGGYLLPLLESDTSLVKEKPRK